MMDKTKHTQHLDETQTPAEFLRGLFLERKKRNSAYSTRAFARDLGISQALLSLVMNGKRPLTVKQAAQISILLGFSTDQTEAFIESALLAMPANSDAMKRVQTNRHNARAKDHADILHKNYEIERFKAISQWYHVAILDLTTTKGFKEDVSWIARRLSISPIEAKDALSRLLDLGLLERKNGKLKKTDSRMYFATQRSEPAVRSFHQQMIGKALDELKLVDDVSFEARQISAMTMSISKSAWPAAKARIQQFQKELAASLGQGECDEVYQLNIQMFPLTKNIKTKSK